MELCLKGSLRVQDTKNGFVFLWGPPQWWVSPREIPLNFEPARPGRSSGSGARAFGRPAATAAGGCT